MSLGGIAIAIGVLVDAGIVVTENVIRHAEAYYEEHGEYRSADRPDHAGGSQISRTTDFLRHDHHHSGVYSGVCAVGMEGKLFHPLAFTKTFAMVGSTLIAVTLVPVLCTFLIRGKLHREDANPVMHYLQMTLQTRTGWALKHRIATLARQSALFVSAHVAGDHDRLGIHAASGRRDSHVHADHRPGISLTKATEILRERRIASLHKTRWSKTSLAKSDEQTPPPIPRRST